MEGKRCDGVREYHRSGELNNWKLFYVHFPSSPTLFFSFACFPFSSFLPFPSLYSFAFLFYLPYFVLFSFSFHFSPLSSFLFPYFLSFPSFYFVYLYLFPSFLSVLFSSLLTLFLLVLWIAKLQLFASFTFFMCLISHTHFFVVEKAPNICWYTIYSFPPSIFPCEV